jgi:hypothetical protein
MSLMDRLKATAGQAKEAAAQVQPKRAEGGLRRKMDECATRLGYLVYRERTQGTPAGSEADVLIAEIGEYEARLAAGAPRSPGTSGEAGTGETPPAPAAAEETTSEEGKP